MVVPFNGSWIAAVVLTAALSLRLFVFLAPVLQGDITLAQFIVAKLYRRAQKAVWLAHAADEFVVAYSLARRLDKSCPRSLWMEVCNK